MRSSAAERSRPTLWDGLVVLAVLAAAGALFFLLLPRGGNFLTARVVLNQEVVTEFPLSALTGTVTFDVPGAEYPITIEAEPGRIRVSHSDCPSQDCVHIGWVDRVGAQIICLPNRLVISLSGAAEPDFDAVSG